MTDNYTFIEFCIDYEKVEEIIDEFMYTFKYNSGDTIDLNISIKIVEDKLNTILTERWKERCRIIFYQKLLNFIHIRNLSKFVNSLSTPIPKIDIDLVLDNQY